MRILQEFPSGKKYEIVYNTDGKKIYEGWLK